MKKAKEFMDELLPILTLEEVEREMKEELEQEK